jgi:HD-like signal output (HDOD) protein
MPADSRENTSASRNHDAFVFVQALAAEASAGRIEIPCFPDVAIRIRRVLADENCDAGQVARVTGAEPALAAKLLHMANSVALNAAGVKVTELKGAIARIGFSNVRTASLASRRLRRKSSARNCRPRPRSRRPSVDGARTGRSGRLSSPVSPGLIR